MNAAPLRALLLALCVLATGACVKPAPTDDALTLRNDDERILYAMGLSLAENNRGLHLLELTPREAVEQSAHLAKFLIQDCRTN